MKLRKKFRTVLLHTVFFRGMKLKYDMFLEECSLENNSVPCRSNSLVKGHQKALQNLFRNNSVVEA